MVTVSGFAQDEYVDPAAGVSAERRRFMQRLRASNSQILGQLVSNIVARNAGQVSDKDMPFHVFEALLGELAACHHKLDLTVYPARKRCYAKYIVYNHKENGAHPFCFTLIVLGPGQKTPKHSHKVDCAPICVLGTIAETLYRETPPAPGKRLGDLQILRKSLYQPFQGGYLLQDQPNVHHLENPTAGLAMSLHLYVFDADPDARGRVGSSVLHIYP